MTVGPVDRDDATATFFDATATGTLLLRRCPNGHVSEASVEGCTSCGRTDLAWVPACGIATVVSWTVVHGRPLESGESGPVTVLVLAELAEGPWWWSQIIDAPDPTRLTVGLPLKVIFVRHDDHSEAVPVFRLTSPQATTGHGK
jgi:uncharacterized OB-fold protein